MLGLVSAFDSLNKLVVALWQSVLEVLWVGVLAVLLLYMVGCLATTLIGHVRHQLGNSTALTAVPQDENLKDQVKVTYDHWGTVQRSMLTLLQASVQ